MPVTLQVMYPKVDGTKFDMDYYLATHLPMVGEHMGPHISSTLVTKGVGGPAPGAPAGYYAVASIIFADQAAMDAAMAVAGPVVADIANFTDTEPQMLVGEVIG